MPYQPRSFAPTFPEHPADSIQPTTSRPSGREERKADKPKRQRMGLETLSLKSYEPDPESVIRLLFGKEVETNARTGELVPAERK